MTDGTSRSPSWLDEACPSWCDAEHAELDHPDDRWHRTAGSVVAAVVADVGTGQVVARAVDLAVWSARRVGQHDVWLFVEESEGVEQRLQISRGSARRITQALLDQEADLAD